MWRCAPGLIFFLHKLMFCYLCRKNVISLEVARYRAAIIEKPIPSYRVVYKKHIVTLEDLLTLADQNWLNDQVIIKHTRNFRFHADF